MKLLLLSIVPFSTVVTVHAYLPSTRPGWGFASDATTIPAGFAKILERSQTFDTSTSAHGIDSGDPGTISTESIQVDVCVGDMTRPEVTDLLADSGEESSSSSASGVGLGSVVSMAPKSQILPDEIDLGSNSRSTKYQGDEPVVEVKYKGFRYHYQKFGSLTCSTCRTPVFLLSGAFMTMESWSKFVHFFVDQGFPVLVADLPGSGQADILPKDYGVDFLAEAAAQVIQHSGSRKVHLIAASYGTPIAYRCTERHPDLVETLILSGTMKQIPSHMQAPMKVNLKLVKEGKMKEAAKQAVEEGLLCRDPAKFIQKSRLAERVLFESIAQMNSRATEQYNENTQRLLQHKPLDLNSSHSIRSLVFTGEHDPFTCPPDSREVAESLNICWFTTIRHADHLFHIEQFKATSELLVRFIRNEPLDSEDLNPIEYTGKQKAKP